MKKALVTFVVLTVAISSCSLFPFLNRVQAETQLAAASVSASARAVASARELPDGSVAVTPTNASGEVITVSVMVGDFGGYALFLITPSEEGFSDAGVTSDSPVLEAFNLSDPITVSREMTVDGGGYPSDDVAVATRIEILFAWVDLDFTLESGPMAGDHTVRVVYADVTDLGYQKGDLLYKDGEVFKWLDTEATATDATLVTARPALTAAIEDLAAYEGTEDGMGNQHIPTFSADIPYEGRRNLPRTELTSGGPWSFTVYFDLTNGMGFDRPLDQLTSVEDLLDAFQIAADVGAGDAGFAATLDVVEIQ